MTRKEHGSALVITLLVLLALTGIGTATVYFASQSSELSVVSRAADQTVYYADAGVNWGVNYILTKGQQAAAAGYKTEGRGGPATNPDLVLTNPAGNAVRYSAGGAATDAEIAVEIGPSPDSKGQTIACGIPGFSERFGSPRFRVDSDAVGPIGARRSVEAHVLMPPREGMCPPGQNVAGGYAGSI